MNELQMKNIVNLFNLLMFLMNRVLIKLKKMVLRKCSRKKTVKKRGHHYGN